MAVIGTDLLMVERAGVLHQSTAADVAALGAAGVGVPVGGATGQVLTKASAADYDTTWDFTDEHYVLTADQGNSTTTADVVPDLTFTPAPDATYLLYVFAMITSAVSTTGAQVGWKFPTAGILDGSLRSMGANTGTAVRTDNVNVENNTTGRSVTTGSGTAALFPTTIECVFRTGPSVTGDFSITIQSEIADSLATIKAGSILKVRRVA